MAKVRHNDIIQKGLFKPTIEGAKALLASLGALEKQLKTILVTSSNLAKSTPLKGFKNIKQIESSINNVAKAEANLAKVEAAKVKIQREVERLQAQRVKLTEQQARQQAKVNEQLQKESGLLGELKSRIAELKKQQLFAKTPAELQKVNTELQKTQREFRELANVGKQSTNTFGKAIQSFGFKFNLLSDIVSQASFAVTSFIRRGIGDSIGLIRDFEKSNAELAGVLNTTRDGVKELTDDAVRLGSETVKTASEVTQLQTAYARLGFTQQEILDLTGATINGSIALNAALDETAELTGAMVRTFDNFSSTDAPEILDKLTASTQKSALNFEKLQTALPIVAGAANTAGISFDRLLALLGKLSDSGIDASSSATALRNIFIESAKQGLSYEQILEKIVNSQDQLTTANDEFGKRAAVSGAILSKNIKATADLEKEISNAGGTAERVAKVQLDTLDGAIQLLTSAWEGFILSLNDGDAISARLAGAIRFLADNLRTIIKILAALVGTFVAYKAAVVASNVATKAYTIATRAASAVQLLFTRGTKAATVAMKSFNTATKANPIGLLVSALTAAVSAFFLFSDAAKDATEKQDAFNKEIVDGVKLLEALDDQFKVQGNNLQQTSTLIENLGKKINDLNKEQLEALAQALRDKVGEATRELENETDELLKTVSQANFDKYTKALTLVTSELEKFDKNTRNSDESTKKLGKSAKDAETAIERLRREVKELNEELLNQAVLGKLSDETFIKFTEKSKELKDAQDELANRIEDTNAGIKSLSLATASSTKRNEEYNKNLPEVDQIVPEDDVRLTEQRLAVIEASLRALNEAFTNASKKRIEQLDRELEATLNRQTFLQEKAAQGVLNAQESLAEEQAKQRRLELAKEKEEARQQKISAGFEILAALLRSGVNPNQAIPQTGALLATLPVVLDAIPTFIEGTGTGTVADALGSPHLNTGEDDYLIRVDGKERIMNPQEASLIPAGMSNFEVAQLAANYSRKTNTSITDERLINEIKELNKTIKNKPEYLGSDIDTVNKLITRTIKKGNNIERNHKRIF